MFSTVFHKEIGKHIQFFRRNLDGFLVCGPGQKGFMLFELGDVTPFMPQGGKFLFEMMLQRVLLFFKTIVCNVVSLSLTFSRMIRHLVYF